MSSRLFLTSLPQVIFPDVDVDVDEYVRCILDEAVEDLRLDYEIDEYVTHLLYHGQY